VVEVFCVLPAGVALDEHALSAAAHTEATATRSDFALR
jgi:hypothetical protein